MRPLTQILVFNCFFLISGLSSHAQAPRPRVEVHVSLADSGKLASIQDLEKSLPSYNKARTKLFEDAGRRGIEVVEHWNSSVGELISTLNNSQVIGVIWVGEARPVHDKLQDNIKPEDAVYNLHLEDASKLNLPKNILKAAHPGLSFLGLNVCFWGLAEKFYQLRTAPFPVLHPFPVDDKTLAGIPVFQQNAVPAIGLRNLYNKALQRLSELPTGAPPAELEQTVELRIDHSDLLSTSFGYTVVIQNPEDQRLVGLLTKESGRRVQQRFQVPKSFVESGSRIVIRPDDPDRESRRVKNPIDNILIHSIQWNNQELLTQTMHLGDSDLVDQEIRLSLPENRPQLNDTPVVSDLEVELR
jgi:hypothetical protein